MLRVGVNYIDFLVLLTALTTSTSMSVSKKREQAEKRDCFPRHVQSCTRHNKSEEPSRYTHPGSLSRIYRSQSQRLNHDLNHRVVAVARWPFASSCPF